MAGFLLSQHPRLGILLLQAQGWGCASLGAELAALLGDRDPLNSHQVGSDLRTRLDWLRQDQREIHRSARQGHQQMRRLSQRLLDQLKTIRQDDQYSKQANKDLSEPVSYTHLTLPTNREV